MPTLSVAGALMSATMLRFHLPLIEPDVRVSRIRLSDWLHSPAHDRHAVVSVVTPRTSQSSLMRKVLSVTAESLNGVDRHLPISGLLVSSRNVPEVRLLPSTGITRLHQ